MSMMKPKLTVGEMKKKTSLKLGDTICWSESRKHVRISREEGEIYLDGDDGLIYIKDRSSFYDLARLLAAICGFHLKREKSSCVGYELLRFIGK